MRPIERRLAVMVSAAERAGAGLLADFASLEKLTITEKAPADLVSSADLGSQETIVRVLRAAFPEIPVLGEEGAAPVPIDGLRFVVDPLDGTTNFLHGIPHFAIAIALEEDGEVLAGVVLDPCRGELFTATRGGGAFLGARRLAVSARRELADAVIATGVPHRGRGNHPVYLKSLASVMAEVGGIRRLGAAALDLAYVAAGRFDGFFEWGLARWDLSAGALIVREAGGRVTEPSGEGDPLASGNVNATNGFVHETLGALVR